MKSNFKTSLMAMAVLLLTGLMSTRAQVISWLPNFPTTDDSLTIIYDATQGNQGVLNADTVYIHTGLVTAGPNATGWVNAQGNWGTRDSRVRMRPLGNNRHLIKVRIRTFYNYPTGNAFRVGMVFRNFDGSRVGRSDQGSDIFLDLIQPGQVAVRFFAPSSSGVIEVEQGVPINVEARSSVNTSMVFSANGNFLASGAGTVATAQVTLQNWGYNWVKVEANQGGPVLARDSFRVFVRKPTTVAAMPAGLEYGITYLPNNTSAILALYAPGKQFSYLLTDANNFDRNNDYLMNRTPDGASYWIQLDNLTPGTEVAFQYLVNGNLRAADPYSDIVLDPFNDQFIPRSTYPNIRTYPRNAQGLVSILQTGQQPYQWRNLNFQRPAKTDLIIYEVLVRDFTNDRNYQRLTDSLNYLKRLGINCIKVMPVNEFDGNISWGYNPALHNAIDKAYGTRNAFKAFVDAAHGMGMAVVIDVVFNHATGASPLATLWWDSGNSRPAADNPYLNPIARHPFNVYNDMNHESTATQYYMDRVIKHFLTEYKVDGFRFDLSKGFTQTFNTDVGAWSNYDASRVRLLKRMADKLWLVDPTAYIILEHLGGNNEETELANYGMMLWGNMNGSYMNATSGNIGGSDLSWGFYRNRGWQGPHLVSYMESHDEERLMVNMRNNGSTLVPGYNLRQTDLALHRMKLGATFFFTIPGPKMIWQFGEMGYDFSINYCPNGTINNDCRTDSKPIRWDYLNDANRINLWKTYAALMRLKATEPIFQNPSPTLTLGSTSAKIIKNSLNGEFVAVVGNFSLGTNNIVVGFQRTGRWYEFFTGDSIEVTNVNQVVNMAAGEFKIFSTKKFFRPDPGILVSLDQELNALPAKAVAYPNPASTELNLQIPINEAAALHLLVYDQMGRVVATKDLGIQNIGTWQGSWDFRSDAGDVLAPGLYRVMAVNGTRKHSMQIVKQ